MSNKIEYKIIENFNEIFKFIKNENNMVAQKEYYEKNFPDIAKGEYKHFGAYINKKLVGTTSMIKFIDGKNKQNKIYHLWGWTDRQHRRKKIWLNLMKIKAKYIKENNWCEDDTINFVAVSKDDNRFKNIGWLEYSKIEKIYNNKPISKIIWYTCCKDYLDDFISIK